jgi:hypothetical protein
MTQAMLSDDLKVHAPAWLAKQFLLRSFYGEEESEWASAIALWNKPRTTSVPISAR